MSVGRVRQARAAWRGVLFLAAWSYALMIATGPALHHDLACELKSRTHCTSCVAGLSAPGLAADTDPPAHQLLPADAPPAAAARWFASPSADAVHDRAPPAA